MFGRREKSTSTSATFDFNDLDDILKDPLPNVDDLDEDVDLNDPDLLRQLHELASGASPPPPPKSNERARQQPPPSSKPKAKPALHQDFDVDAYTSMVGPIDEDIEVELDENDLNDPNLLKELSALNETRDTDGPQQNVTENIHEVDVEAGKLREEVAHVMSMGFSEQQANDALSMFDNHVERATNYLLDQSHQLPEQGAMEENTASKDVSMELEPHTVSDTVKDSKATVAMETEEAISAFDDPDDLLKRAAYYQKQALVAKRQGDKKKAVELMRQSKIFAKRHQELQEDLSGTKEPEKTPSFHEEMDRDQVMEESAAASDTKLAKRTNSQMTAQVFTDQSQTTKPTPGSSDSGSTSVNTNLEHANVQEKAQQLLITVAQRQQQYKEAALHYKNLGNLPVAKEMLKNSKELLKLGTQLKQGQFTDLSVVERNMLPEPDLSRGDGKIRQIQQVEITPNQSFEHLESQLTYQLNVCHNLAVQSDQQGRKPSSKALADMSASRNHFVQLEQAFAADLVSLRSRRDQKQETLPQLHYEQVEYVYKNILDHIPSNQMEFKIIKGTSLQSLDVSSIEPFVTWDFNGWPPETTAQAGLGKGETPVQKGSDPVFDFVLNIPIVRNNRVFLRHIQRKKLVLEVFHNRYNYGLFRRPLSLGKISIPLDSLLTKSSISGVFELTDANRRKTGGKLEVQVNLREPISGEDIAKRSERWLAIHEFNNDVSKLLAAARLTTGVYQPSPQRVVSGPSDTSKSASPPSSEAAREPEKPTTQPKITKEDKTNARSSAAPAAAVMSSSDQVSELEAAEEEFNNVDNIVSNMVLEHEIAQVTKALASTKLTPQMKEEMTDRKQALDIKMNMLVVQVQTGMLDMDTYIRMVRKRMERDLQLALLFKKHNRLDLAKGALSRKKIMQEEVDEVMNAMENDNE